MELQDRVTVVLTKYGANVLNKQNKEYNDKFPKSERRRTDYAVGELLSDYLFNIIDTFKDHFHIGRMTCFMNIIPEIKGIQESKWRVLGDLENLKLRTDKLNLEREYLERLGVTFKGDKMIMGQVKVTADTPNSTRGKHGDIRVKICTGVFLNGKLVSIFDREPTPVNIPAEKDEFVSLAAYEILEKENEILREINNSIEHASKSCDNTREMFDEMRKGYEKFMENLNARLMQDQMEAYKSIIFRVKNRIESESEVIGKLIGEIENGEINGKQFSENMKVILSRLIADSKQLKKEFQ